MAGALQLVDFNLSSGSLEAYIQRVNQFPMLTATQERELAERLVNQQDVSAARELVLAHLRFVVKVARGYAGYGLAQADLIQEGNVGLLKAVKRFDPNVGVRLVSFAVHWIKAEMHEYILRNWRIVKVATTKAQRKLFFNLRSTKKRLGWASQQEVNDVANTLGVKPQEVMLMEARLNAQDVAYDGATDADDEHTTAPKYYLEDKRADPALLLEHSDAADVGAQRLRDALTTLDARARAIIQRRWLTDKKATLHELAAEYQISAERVRQLEANAIKKLKTALVEM